MNNLSRRGFFVGAGIFFAAPAIVRASSLMPVKTPLVMRSPGLWRDGIHDDTAALQFLMDEAAAKGELFVIPAGSYNVSNTLVMRGAVRMYAAVITGRDLPLGAPLIRGMDGSSLKVMNRCNVGLLNA